MSFSALQLALRSMRSAWLQLVHLCVTGGRGRGRGAAAPKLAHDGAGKGRGKGRGRARGKGRGDDGAAVGELKDDVAEEGMLALGDAVEPVVGDGNDDSDEMDEVHDPDYADMEDPADAAWLEVDALDTALDLSCLSQLNNPVRIKLFFTNHCIVLFEVSSCARLSC